MYFEGVIAPPLPGMYEFVYFGVSADNPGLLSSKPRPEEMVPLSCVCT